MQHSAAWLDMDRVIGEFSDWLSATPFSLVIQTQEWIIPAIQSMHIMAVSVIMGSAIMIDLKLLGVAARGSSISDANRRFLPWIWSAMGLLLLTGALLTAAGPRRELLNDIFRLKMGLILLIVAVTAAFQHTVRRNSAAWDEDPGKKMPARLLAIGSLAVWVAILFCGRWIAYVEHG